MGRLRIDRLCRESGRVVDAGGRVVVARCHLADRPLGRLVGLLGTAALEPGEGVLISPCSSVHTVGMRFAVRCVFLDDAFTVMRVVDLPPGRVAAARGSSRVLEFAAARSPGPVPGDRLRLE